MKISALVMMTVLMGVMTSKQVAAGVILQSEWDSTMEEHARYAWQQDTVFPAGSTGNNRFDLGGNAYLYAIFDGTDDRLTLNNTGSRDLEYFVKDRASRQQRCIRKVIKSGDAHRVSVRDPQIWVRIP